MKVNLVAELTGLHFSAGQCIDIHLVLACKLVHSIGEQLALRYRFYSSALVHKTKNSLHFIWSCFQAIISCNIVAGMWWKLGVIMANNSHHEHV